MSLYDRMNLLLSERNITRKKLCDDIQVPYNTINSMIKRQSQTVSIDILIKISNYLSVSVDYLLGISDRRNNELAENEERWDYYVTVETQELLAKLYAYYEKFNAKKDISFISEAIIYTLLGSFTAVIDKHETFLSLLASSENEADFQNALKSLLNALISIGRVHIGGEFDKNGVFTVQDYGLLLHDIIGMLVKGVHRKLPGFTFDFNGLRYGVKTNTKNVDM